MTWLLILKVAAALFAGFVVFVVAAFLLPSQIARFQITLSKPYDILDPQVDVEELPPLATPLPNNYFERKAAINENNWLLTPENDILQGQRFLDDDPNKHISYLPENGWVIMKGEIKTTANGKLDRTIHQFQPPFRSINDVFYLTPKVLLLGADDGTTQYVNHKLWLLNGETFAQQLLDNEPYYFHARSPLVVRGNDSRDHAVVYYSGNYSFGYGGDSSAPKYSTLRIFNKAYPMGKDLLRLAFKAGTIEKLEWRDNAWIVTTDPSLPSATGTPRVPARQWRVSVQAE